MLDDSSSTMAGYRVDVFSLNVNQGDSALHTLSRNDKVISIVLVDGGEGRWSKYLEYFLFFRLENELGFKRENDHIPFFCLDAIVATHWDTDHYTALGELLFDGVNLTLQKWVYDPKQCANQDEFISHINNHNVGCPYMWFNNDSVVQTRWYSPPRPAGGGMLPPKTSYQQIQPGAKTEMAFSIRKDNSEDYLTIELSIIVPRENTLKEFTGWVKVAKIISDPLYHDAFTGNLLEPNYRENPALISRKLHEGNLQPVMVCVASNKLTVCDHETRKKVWVQKEKYTTIGIAPQGNIPDGWENIPFCKVPVANDGMPDSVSTKIINIADSSKKNPTSIAFLTIWPAETGTGISNYCAGDLNEGAEEEIVKWSAFSEHNNDIVRICPPVDCVKLSHHG